MENLWPSRSSRTAKVSMTFDIRLHLYVLLSIHVTQWRFCKCLYFWILLIIFLPFFHRYMLIVLLLVHETILAASPLSSLNLTVFLLYVLNISVNLIVSVYWSEGAMRLWYEGALVRRDFGPKSRYMSKTMKCFKISGN